MFSYLADNDLLPVIYFTFSRKRTEQLADELMRFDFLKENEKRDIMALYSDLRKAFDLEHDRTAEYLVPFIRRGIAFHHAGLLPTLKEVIERLFTSRLLKAIFTTETFGGV
jgi:superfamily II RNA helicase